jgi:hypothetical protein
MLKLGTSAVRLFGAALVATCLFAAGAQAQTSGTIKQCADRWNEMKAKDATGDLTYREFSQKCLAEAAAGSKPASSSQSAPKPSAATQPTQGGASAQECAARWNDMKAKDQTGDLTYRQFSQSCMAGSAAAPKPSTTTSTKPAATTTSRTSVPSAGSRSSPPVTAQEEDDETDKEALDRCNGEWKTYKAKNNLTGAKAWHVFMAKCL